MKISEIKNHLENDEIILWQKIITVNLIWETFKLVFYVLCIYSLIIAIPFGYFIYDVIQNNTIAKYINPTNIVVIILIISCYGVCIIPGFFERKKIIQKLKKTQDNPKKYLHYLILTNSRIIIKNFDNFGKRSSKSRGLTIIKDVGLIYFRFIDKVEVKRDKLQIYHYRGKHFHHVIGLDISFSSNEYKIFLSYLKEFFPFGKFYRTQELKTVGDEIDEMEKSMSG